jgi:hypothetical protein
LAADVAALAELIEAKAPGIMFLGTVTARAMGYFFLKPPEMSDEVFMLADLFFPLAEWFGARQAEACNRICNAVCACFARKTVRDGWDLPTSRMMCQFVFCSSARTNPDETGLRLLGPAGDDVVEQILADALASENSDFALVQKTRAWARQCLRTACLRVRRRLLLPCGACGRVPHAGFHNGQPGGLPTFPGKKDAPLKMCGGGCGTGYCDRQCQKAHWRAGHRELCRVAQTTPGPKVSHGE